MGKSLKNFVGEYAYNIIKNSAVDGEKLRSALVTPQNARNVFSELTEFEVKGICTEICNSGEIGVIRKTNQAEIIEAFKKAGYDTVIFDDENRIREAQKYYRAGETICTYGNLAGRMREYHMIVAIKANIDDIKHADDPQRDDEYGTSILNIQIARNGSHMSIKNRYNHAVNNPDATLNNNLDMLSPGLQSMVLGYYGFASLRQEKQYYKNVVKIGGIYLKWHTEHNNKYYGAFVLDAEGAKYTDTSRYYVAERTEGGRWYNQPLVLDFHKKEVCEMGLIKRVLVSRALREGILSSANKEQANYISATFTDAKRELLQTNRKALRYAAEVYGYDFQKPYTVSAIMGKFTANSIEKAFNVSSALLFICHDDKLHAVKLANGRFYANDIKGRYDDRIDTFTSQGTFEEVRKSGNSAVFVINQDKKYHREVKRREEPSRWGYNRPDEFDKSGCNITEAKRQLDSRLRKYKYEKHLNEAKRTDFSADLAEVKAKFAEFKAELIKAMTSANTSEDYRKIGKASDYRLEWLVRDIDELEKHVKANDFKSVQSAKKDFNDALNGIAKRLGILAGTIED
jgi:hypothetical protein